MRSRLVRLGFTDPDGSAALLTSLGEYAGALSAFVAATADPDAALRELIELAAVVPDSARLLDELVDDEGTAMRLLSVLGASPALAHHLRRHPEQWRELTDPALGSTRPAAYAIRTAL